MARCGGNRTQAAELIGVTRQALARHLKRGD
ncbi:MAG: helix-turn-helix domain-containing protein [Desulfovibrionaceae bacterium]